MSDLKVLSLIDSFPVGSTARTRKELLSKVEIISFLAKYQDQFSMIENIDERELSVKNYLSDIVGLGTNEQVPNIDLAEVNLGLSHGFVQDFDKIELIKNSNPTFNETYNSIASDIKLSQNVNKSI